MKLDLNESVGKYFKWGELLFLPSWNLYVFPDETSKFNLIKLASKLDLIRDHFNRPINIHCAYRPRAYNDYLRKYENYQTATNSCHIFGEAADFHVEGLDCDEVKLELEKHLDDYQIGLEDSGSTWIHVDVNINHVGKFFKP